MRMMAKIKTQTPEVNYLAFTKRMNLKATAEFTGLTEKEIGILLKLEVFPVPYKDKRGIHWTARQLAGFLKTYSTSDLDVTALLKSANLENS